VLVLKEAFKVSAQKKSAVLFLEHHFVPSLPVWGKRTDEKKSSIAFAVYARTRENKRE
jgi:hypothetical protein